MSYENKRGLAKSREILVSCTVRLLLLGSPPGDLGPSVPYVTYIAYKAYLGHNCCCKWCKCKMDVGSLSDDRNAIVPYLHFISEM